MRILQIVGYPIGRPLQGGPKRCSALRKALVHAGHCVRTLCVSYANSVANYGTSRSDEVFLIPSKELNDTEAMAPVLEDVLPALFFLSKEIDVGKLMARCERFRPEVLILEHPFLWPLFRDYCISQRIFVVYSSHNVESSLKRELYAGSLSPESAEIFSRLVSAIESQLVLDASAIICVTEADRKYWGIKAKKRSLVVPNASDRPVRDEESARVLQSLLDKRGFKRYAFFVGSDHDPNLVGFASCLGDNLSFLPPHKGILVMGGVRNALARQGFWEGLYGNVNQARTLSMVSPDDKMVETALLGASVVLLPITRGAGSNLKTAQAILSAKPILATEFSFRGYSDFAARARISKPEDFRMALVEMLETEQIPCTCAEENEEVLTWQYQGGEYAVALEEMFKTRGVLSAMEKSRAMGQLEHFDLKQAMRLLHNQGDATPGKACANNATSTSHRVFGRQQTFGQVRFRIFRMMAVLFSALSEDDDAVFIDEIQRILVGDSIATARRYATVDHARDSWGRLAIVLGILFSRRFAKRLLSRMTRSRSA